MNEAVWIIVGSILTLFIKWLFDMRSQTAGVNLSKSQTRVADAEADKTIQQIYKGLADDLREMANALRVEQKNTAAKNDEVVAALLAKIDDLEQIILELRARIDVLLKQLEAQKEEQGD